MNLWLELDRRFHRLGLVDTKPAQAGAFRVALVVATASPALLSVASGGSSQRPWPAR